MARRRHTGWGNGVQRANPPSVLLFNFDIDSPSLKIEHRDMLRSWVVPYIRDRHHSISIVGLASRTGATAHNQKLSQDRADNALRFLQSEVRDGFNFRSVIGFGELKAAAEGERDNTEDPRFRSVLILTAPGPTPPPPPPKIDLEKLVPKAFKHEGFSLDIGQINDLVNGMVGLIENVAPELPELAENILAKADIATAVIAAVIGMPMLWAGVSEQSEINGYKQGYWEGMEDMARRYSNDALRKQPLRQWPALEEPRPRPIVGYSGTTTERDWMEGKEKGCKLAFVVVSQFERARPGAGKVLLFTLWYQYGENLGESIKRAVIKKTGNVWPKIDF